MVKSGTPVVVANRELKEMYTAVLFGDWNTCKRAFPLVKIQTIIMYPRQTAILYDDVLCENEPLKEGQKCRMQIVAFRSCVETMRTYEQSFSRALSAAIHRAQQQGRKDVVCILERHGKGQFNRRRLTCDH